MNFVPIEVLLLRRREREEKEEKEASGCAEKEEGKGWLEGGKRKKDLIGISGDWREKLFLPFWVGEWEECVTLLGKRKGGGGGWGVFLEYGKVLSFPVLPSEVFWKVEGRVRP